MALAGNLVGITLSEVASWALPDEMAASHCPIQASLPAIQRGSVWKPSQVERLWDSLARGLPIGSLLFAEFDAERRNRPIDSGVMRATMPLPTHHLLDGQQRSLAIALGYLDVWT